jgi:hypothetical protein
MARTLEEPGDSDTIPPAVSQQRMEAAHIIPFSLNNFNINAVGGLDFVRDAKRNVLSISHLALLCK